MLVPFASLGLITLFSSLVRAGPVYNSESPANMESPAKLESPAKFESCSNSDTTFTNSLQGWTLERGVTDKSYEFTEDGLVMKITPPANYVRLYDNVTANNCKSNHSLSLLKKFSNH